MDDDALESAIFTAAQYAVKANAASDIAVAEVAARLKAAVPIAMRRHGEVDDDTAYRVMADGLVDLFVSDAMDEITEAMDAEAAEKTH